MSIRKNKKSIAVMAISGALVAGGAYAAIPSADGTITACYDPANPVVKVLDTAQSASCPAGQQQISWNQGQRFAGAYDIAKDRANGYEVGDIVHMNDCPMSSQNNAGSYVKVRKVALGSDESKPCQWVSSDGKTATGAWAVVARNGMRGPTGYRGPAGPAYAVRIAASDNATDRFGGTYMRTWSQSDIAWINTPSLDATKCAATATPVSNNRNAAVIRADVSYKDWFAFYTSIGGAPAKFPIDVTISCPES